MNTALAYPFGGALYLNITDRCPVSCRFCPKREGAWSYDGWSLRLGGREPSADEVWEEARSLLPESRPRELVFCGYGEPTWRLPVLLELARRAAAELPALPLRLNTIGLGSLLWGRDIAPELAESLDSVSISLNTADPALWRLLHRPLPRLAGRGYGAVLDFARRCLGEGLETTITAVELPGADLEGVARLARGLGASFRSRPLLREALRPSSPAAT